MAETGRIAAIATAQPAGLPVRQIAAVNLREPGELPTEHVPGERAQAAVQSAPPALAARPAKSTDQSSLASMR
jgi:hypothetical protein